MKPVNATRPTTILPVQPSRVYRFDFAGAQAGLDKAVALRKVPRGDPAVAGSPLLTPSYASRHGCLSLRETLAQVSRLLPFGGSMYARCHDRIPR